MDREQSFLEAIRRRPDSRAIRLVYADWLTDRGDPRGEFIHLQCQAGRLSRHSPRRMELQGRIDELLLRYEAQWLGPLIGVAGNWEWKNGLLDWVTLRTVDFLVGAERWLPALPLLGVHLRQAKNHVAALSRCPALRHLCGLYLGDNDLTDNHLHELLTSPYLHRIRSLFLQSNALGERGARLLAETTSLPRLDELNVGRNRLGDTGVAALAAAAHLGRLRRLHLTMTGVEEAGLQALIASELLPHLTVLSISLNRLQPGSLAALAAAPGLARLRVLIADLNQFGDTDVAALAASPYAAGLRCLALESYETLGDAALKALATSTPLRQLRALSIGSGPWGLTGARALARSRTLRSLRSLHVTQSSQRSKGVARELFGSLLGSRLRHLDLQIGGLGKGALTALLEQKRPLQLRRLDVPFTRPMLGAWEKLAASRKLAGLTDLVLTDALPGALRSVLVPERFPKLRSLSLDGVPDLDEFQALLDSPVFGRLHRLRIGLHYGDEEKLAPDLLCRVTAVWNHSALRRLELRWSLSLEEVQQLTAGPPPSSLMELEIGVFRLKEDGITVLANWPLLGQLRKLELANSSTNAVPGLEALVNSPHVGPLLRVDIHNGHAPREMHALLRRRFGLRFAVGGRMWPRQITMGGWGALLGDNED